MMGVIEFKKRNHIKRKEIINMEDKHNQTISDFGDFRLAVLFTLGKYRWEINHRHIND